MRADFLKSFIFLSLAILLITAGLNLFVLPSIVLRAHEYLMRYQFEKIESSTGIETVFVGDSSLGNAINAELFSELSGHKTLNLALVGNYGYAGSYAMALRAAKKFKLKNIVILQTLEMLQREPAPERFVFVGGFSGVLSLLQSFSKNDVQYLKGLGLGLVNFQIYKQLLKAAVGAKDSQDFNSLIQNDYIIQGPKVEFTEFETLKRTSISAHKAELLHALVRFAKKSGIRLIYAHGPYYEKAAEGSKDYILEANHQIREVGIELVDWVPALSYEHMGDNNKDHVFPGYKDEMTRQYAEKLLPRMKR